MNIVVPVDTPVPDRLIDAESRVESGGTPILLEYLRVVERRRWLIAAILAVAILTAVIVTLLMTPQYTASARVEISACRILALTRSRCLAKRSRQRTPRATSNSRPTSDPSMPP